MCEQRLPPLWPPKWRAEPIPGHGRLLVYQGGGPLTATCTDDTFCAEHQPDPERQGSFRRIVLSCPDRYPSWEEMRDFIRSCGLFDRSRAVLMYLPPDAEYINLHNFAMHWFQRLPRSYRPSFLLHGGCWDALQGREVPL